MFIIVDVVIVIVITVFFRGVKEKEYYFTERGRVEGICYTVIDKEFKQSPEYLMEE